MTYELRLVASAEDRAAMHAIRRATLFSPDRPGGPVVYDENHPHDINPANQCFLLVLDEQPIGVVRLDPRGEHEGVVRQGGAGARHAFILAPAGGAPPREGPRRGATGE